MYINDKLNTEDNNALGFRQIIGFAQLVKKVCIFCYQHISNYIINMSIKLMQYEVFSSIDKSILNIKWGYSFYEKYIL